MVAITYDMEVKTSIPPAKLFKAFILDGDNLIPKILPEAIKCVEYLEGDGGVGTVKKLTFGEGSHYKYAKHKIDGIDKENFTYSYTIIEGDALHDILESINYHIKIVACDGGSICKHRSIYHTKGEHKITEEQIKGGKEKAIAMFKAVETYLEANPDAY